MASPWEVSAEKLNLLSSRISEPGLSHHPKSCLKWLELPKLSAC
ncbi:hypothetical protein ANCCAN_26905 [Ancylostoma caninum]|uniref:Uncharacterized protein n=1 Tax=Ancylostoma caninum TaxID=29170 RepID=A0A368F5G4_ANCCA|nr:hypothetical protein ANCCAN_26905 [Ancylostoma caninum]